MQSFKKLVAILRLAVPYTGMIISTRESVEMRTEAFSLGISQTSAGSRTSPGGYGKSGEEGEAGKSEQFQVADHRPPDEMIRSICESGLSSQLLYGLLSAGEDGERIHGHGQAGGYPTLCAPNAILTFKEYLLDYATGRNPKGGRRKPPAAISKKFPAGLCGKRQKSVCKRSRKEKRYLLLARGSSEL